jgi:hypothetical protein
MVFFFGRFFLNEFYPEGLSMINLIGSQNAFRFSPLRYVRHESENPCNNTQNLPEVPFHNLSVKFATICPAMSSSLGMLTFGFAILDLDVTNP